MTRINIGLIVDDLVSSKMNYDFIKRSLTAENYKVTHLIIQKLNTNDDCAFKATLPNLMEHGINSLITEVSYNILKKLERLFFKKLSRFEGFFDSFDLNQFALNTIEVIPLPSKCGSALHYSQQDIEKIKATNLGLLVSGTEANLNGKILNICKNGIIKIHLGDIEKYSGGQSGFWEVANKKKITNFSIQRFTENASAGEILFEGSIATSYMWTLNFVNLSEKANPFLNYIIENIASENSKLQVKEKTLYTSPVKATPSIGAQFSYIFATLRFITIKIIRKISGRAFRWGVAYQFVDNWRDVQLSQSKRIPNPPNRYLADPFIIKKNGNHFCFVEDYVYKKKRGHISVYKLTEDACEEIGIALQENFHLSYPFLFEHAGEIFMCPETHEVREIRLYRCIDFPLKWELHTVLMSDVSAADTTIHYRDNKWWLMTNICSSDLGDHQSELHIFSSNDLFSKVWIPHPQNPIFFNPLNARNGGFIADKNGVFRVFQKHGFSQYGEALGVAKIEVLDQFQYAENLELTVTADFFPNLYGTHTYNFCDGLLALDYLEIDKKK